MDFETFKTINERFPMVLFPSFRLQDNLQAFTLGACSTAGPSPNARLILGIPGSNHPPPPPPDLALGTLCGKLGACESSVLANAVVCTARSGCMASTARIYQDEVQAGDVPSGHGGQAASQAHPGPPSDVRAGPAVEEVRPYQGRHWRGGRWTRCVVGGCPSARAHSRSCRGCMAESTKSARVRAFSSYIGLIP